MRATMNSLAALLGGLAFVAATGTAIAQETPPPGGEPKDFQLAEATEYALPNGLGVTMVPYGKVPKTSVQLVIRAGNIDESADEVWLADLTGDLMKEGTLTRSAKQIAQEAAGMGGSLNIGVGEDQSSVSGQVLSEFGTELVALIADVTLNPAFPESELERLKTDRVRQVSMAHTSAQAVTQEKFRAVMYPDHPYGRLFPTEEQMQGYTLEQIRGFYDQKFGAARSHLYVTGVFNEKAMREAIEEAFGGWKEGLPPVTDVPSPVTGRAVHVVDRPGAPQSTIAVGLPTIDPSQEDFVALQVTNALLGGSFASRITANIREDKGYTYSPISHVSTRYRDASGWRWPTAARPSRAPRWMRSSTRFSGCRTSRPRRRSCSGSRTTSPGSSCSRTRVAAGSSDSWRTCVCTACPTTTWRRTWTGSTTSPRKRSSASCLSTSGPRTCCSW